MPGHSQLHTAACDADTAGRPPVPATRQPAMKAHMDPSDGPPPKLLMPATCYPAIHAHTSCFDGTPTQPVVPATRQLAMHAHSAHSEGPPTQPPMPATRRFAPLADPNQHTFCLTATCRSDRNQQQQPRLCPQLHSLTRPPRPLRTGRARRRPCRCSRRCRSRGRCSPVSCGLSRRSPWRPMAAAAAAAAAGMTRDRCAVTAAALCDGRTEGDAPRLRGRDQQRFGRGQAADVTGADVARAASWRARVGQRAR
eukprot:365415-Chlamydomonas_euryale.AAC.11